MRKGTKATRLSRAWVAALLVNVLVVKLILGSVVLFAQAGSAPDAASYICHSFGDPESPDAPSLPHDRHCDECCLVRAATLEAPPLPVAFAILLPPSEARASDRGYAAALLGPPVEAWSPIQAQRAPPSRLPV